MAVHDCEIATHPACYNEHVFYQKGIKLSDVI